MFETTGDELDETGNPMSEQFELWRRDPVECIRELMGNPSFKDVLHYAPEKLFSQPFMDEKHRIWNEMWAGDWWWRVQVLLRVHRYY